MPGHPLTYQASSSYLSAEPWSSLTPSGLSKDQRGPDQTDAVSGRLEQSIEQTIRQSSGPKPGLSQLVNCASSRFSSRPGVADVTRPATVRIPSLARISRD